MIQISLQASYFQIASLIWYSEFRWGNSSFRNQVIFTEITSAAELPINYN